MVTSKIQNAKRAAAERAVSYIENNMTVGLGTGSTSMYAIQFIGERVKDGLKIKGVPTSLETGKLAQKYKIPLLKQFSRIDVTIDGADEVDPDGNLIKGGGGALTREKIVAAASDKEIIIVDESKQVEKLGAFPLPVEILPFAKDYLHQKLKSLGCEVTLRKKGSKIFVTDNENYIFDCHFGEILDPGTLSREINALPGAVENGLFVGLTDLVIVGHDEDRVEEIKI